MKNKLSDSAQIKNRKTAIKQINCKSEKRIENKSSFFDHHDPEMVKWISGRKLED